MSLRRYGNRRVGMPWGLTATKTARLCFVLAMLASLSFAANGASSSAPLYPSPQERFGVCVALQKGGIDDYDVGQLRAGWYQDWGVNLNPPHPNGMEYVQTIRVSGSTHSPDLATLGPIVDNNPGAIWLIGNEPDCIWQDNSLPEEYAVVYHELYTFIKGRDPTAKVAIGGIVQPTPLRLQYLDKVLEEYQRLYGEMIPVDIWNIHNAILQEKRGSWGADIPPGLDADEGMLYGIQDNDNIDVFKQHILAFRQWMKDKGERDKPLIVSEYGVLMPGIYGFDYVRVKNFMYATFDYLSTAVDDSLGYPADENKLVQRWAWYSLNDDAIEGFVSHSHLFNPNTKQITQLGIDYGNYVRWVTAHKVFLPLVFK